MALRVWLPLNGNIENKGLSNITIVNDGATIDDSGKIGKCYSFDGNDDFISVDYPQSFNNNWTYCCWIYNDDAAGRSIFYGDFSLPNTGNISIEKTTAEKVRFYWNNGNPDVTFNNSIIATSAWTHLALTYDGTVVSCYINGTLTDTRSGALTSVTKTGLYYIGRDGRTGGTAFKGKMNDFRIYDECLSDKQIKEISKGLICHYKMTGVGANENLLLHSDQYTQSNPRIQSGTGTDIYNVLGMYYNGLDTSKYYILSVCSNGTLDSSHAGSTSKDVTKRYWTIWLYYSNTTYTDSNCGSFDSPYVYTSSDNSDARTYLGHIGYRHYWKIKPGYSNCSVRVNAYSNGTDTVNVKFWDIKLEEGTNLTAWIPNKNDSLYTVLGYNNPYADVSGNGYNASQAGTLTFNHDSPKYDGCTYFNGSSYINSSWGSMTWFNFDNATISAWMKPTVTPSDWTGSIGFQHDGGNTDNKTFTISNYGGKFSVHAANTGSWAEATITSETLPLNTWSYCVATLENGSNLKMYINGELVKTTTIDYKTATVRNDTCIGIGADFPGSDEKYTGYYSDIRIYSTVLSADDIKKLYNRASFIDNKKNFYAYEFESTLDNLIAPAANAIIQKQFVNGLSGYNQTNCQTSITDTGYRVYRTPNIDSSAQNMWGGLRITPNFAGDVLLKGHKYILLYDVKGKTNNAQVTIGWSNNMGWGGGGLMPSPSNIVETHIPENFNSDDWVTFYYQWEINDNVWKTCTESYSSFVAGTTYLSYRDFQVGWGYQSTGSWGTDIYINHIRLYDITDITNPKLYNNGKWVIGTIEEINNINKIQKNEIKSNDFFEI